jgi:hypothetical protein
VRQGEEKNDTQVVFKRSEILQSLFSQFRASVRKICNLILLIPEMMTGLILTWPH